LGATGNPLSLVGQGAKGVFKNAGMYIEGADMMTSYGAALLGSKPNNPTSAYAVTSTDSNDLLKKLKKANWYDLKPVGANAVSGKFIIYNEEIVQPSLGY
jgi:hypothetical protein